MANANSRARKPRIRKAPTRRQQIEDDARKAEKPPRRRRSYVWQALIWPFAKLKRLLQPVLRPLAPVGRLLKRVLRWLVPSYFVNSWRELRKVTWPKRAETWRLTAAVFIFALVFGTLIAVVDRGLDEIFKKLILKQ